MECRSSEAVLIGRDGKRWEEFADVDGTAVCAFLVVPSLASDSTSVGDRFRRRRAPGAGSAFAFDFRGAAAFLAFVLGGVSSMTMGSGQEACQSYSINVKCLNKPCSPSVISGTGEYSCLAGCFPFNC